MYFEGVWEDMIGKDQNFLCHKKNLARIRIGQNSWIQIRIQWRRIETLNYIIEDPNRKNLSHGS